MLSETPKTSLAMIKKIRDRMKNSLCITDLIEEFTSEDSEDGAALSEKEIKILKAVRAESIEINKEIDTLFNILVNNNQ